MTAPTPSRGAIALKNCGKSQQQVAKRIDRSYPVVNNWVKGHRKPDDASRGRLEAEFGIPRSWWDEAAVQSTPPSGGSGQGGFLDKIDRPPPSGEQGVIVALPNQGPPKDPHRETGVEAFRGGEGVGPVDLRSEAEALIAQIRRYRHDAEHDPTSSPTERAKLLDMASRALERAYRQTGEAANIPASRILASPAWGRIRESVVGALEAHPEALRAVVAALEGVE